MTLAAGSPRPPQPVEAQVLTFHNLGPLDLPALLERYEALRLRHLYAGRTVDEHKRVIRNAAKKHGDAVLETDPHDMAEGLYSHLSPERGAKYVHDAESILEAFQGWYARTINFARNGV